jgi:hypothetical protein
VKPTTLAWIGLLPAARANETRATTPRITLFPFLPSNSPDFPVIDDFDGLDDELMQELMM